MIQFFDHIGNRQSSHGIKDAFRFKAVLSSRKKGDLTKAVYKELETTTLFDQGPDMFHNIVMPDSTSQGLALVTMADTRTETALENESHQESNIEQMMSVFAINQVTAPAPAASTTQDTDTEPALALTQVTRSLRPRPRPIIPKKKVDKRPAQVIMGTEQAPALTEATPASTEATPASTEATGLVRPRPRPIQKKKAGEQACVESQSGIVPEMASSDHPTLVLDREYQWEPRIDLDPSLDPSFNPSDITPEPAFNTCNRAWLPMTPISPSTSSMPESAKTFRRKSNKADLLAIEEAKNYMATGKRRR
jgi:hypothetical protein